MIGGGDADPVDVGRGHLGDVVRPRDAELLAELVAELGTEPSSDDVQVAAACTRLLGGLEAR